ncbi:MAG TPA: DUF1707 domain-containing protein, partial [Pilimelia sp.]|nr:DUF1707 domain-containing protein [Pilimelia sp.]
ASDAEREQIATILRAAMTEGRLNLQEGEERLAAAYAATYRDELGPLTADLPDGGRRALYETPEAKASARRLLRRHGTFVAVVAAALVGLWALSGAHFFWPIIPLAFLAIGFAKHRRYHRRGYWRGGWQGHWSQSGHWGQPGRWGPPHRSGDRWS